MVQRTKAGGISQMGRATQGVRVMNMKEDDRISAVALVVESTNGAEAVVERTARRLAKRRGLSSGRRGGGERARAGTASRRAAPWGSRSG